MSMIPFRTGRVGGFDPTRIPGLLGWYQAEAEAYTDGQDITVIHDLSGNSRDLNNEGGAFLPKFRTNIINGKPAFYLPHFNTESAFPHHGLFNFNNGLGVAFTQVSVFVACHILNQSIPGNGNFPRVVTFGKSVSGQEVALSTDMDGTHWAAGDFDNPSATKGDAYSTTSTQAWEVVSFHWTKPALPGIRVNQGLVGGPGSSIVYDGVQAGNPPASWADVSTTETVICMGQGPLPLDDQAVMHGFIAEMFYYDHSLLPGPVKPLEAFLQNRYLIA